MAQIILEDSEYTFDASAKTVTLGAPYTGLSLGQIISIIDLKTNDVLYDSVVQRTDPISISAAVITHTHGNTGQADTDKLQIIVDIGGSAAVPIHVSTGGAIASEVKDGRQAVAAPGTAVALASSTACKRVTVVAEEDNTGIIVVGGSTVVAALATRRGVPLHPLDSYSLNADDLDEVFIDAMVATDGCTYSYGV